MDTSPKPISFSGKSIKRRDFLKSTSGILALAAFDLSNGASAFAQEAGPSTAPAGEQLNVAVIGLGLRAPSHLRGFGARNNCRITHVCDPDTSKAKAAVDIARTSNNGFEPAFVQDMRRIIDDKSVHAISIVAPNHWHALASLWGMQAGKDVYVEKPMSHSFAEGRRMVDTAARTGRVLQVGTQMRSNPALRNAMQYLQSGALGKVKVGRALCYKPRATIGLVDAPQPPPATLDYDLWCGPAPMAPIRRTKFHYDWHWQWDYGNGDIGNQGLHETDIALWAMNVKTLPRSAVSVGGRFGYVDDGQTPNTQVASFDFGDDQPKLIIEVRGLTTPPFRQQGVETVIHCEKGYLVNPTYTSVIAYDLDGHELQRFEGGNDALHFDNFVNVVRSRKMQDLHANAMAGHLAAGCVHLGNISYRLGTPTPLAAAAKASSNSDTNESVERMVAHLAENKIDSAPLTLGRLIKFDPATEKILNDEQANQMLSREERAPYRSS